MKKRRCQESRWDFTAEDDVIFPIRISDGGELYGFCPGKVTWDYRTVDLFNLLTITAELKTMPYDGGLVEQDAWFIELLSWFLPKYDFMKFSAKADMILGGNDSKKVQNSLGKSHGGNRRTTGQNRSR